jgi:hypothetical protein
VPGGGLSGTATADRSAATGYALSGAATPLLAHIAPFLSRDRRTSATVYIDGVNVSGLVGDVQITYDTSTLTKKATIQVVDSRASFLAAASIIRGDKAVQIDLTAEDSTLVIGEATWTAFVGVIDSVSDEDAYCPRATIQCVSVSQLLYANSTAGCLNAPAFSGVTRRDILEGFAASVGVSLDLSGLPSAATVRQPVSLSGVSIEALLLRYSELEGWYGREGGDGSLEVLTEREVLGVRPKFLLTEDRYMSLREDPPNHPTTSLTVGGSRIGRSGQTVQAPVLSEDSSEQVVGGVHTRTVVRTWTQYDVVIKTVTEEWADYSIKGVTDGPVMWLLVKRTTAETSYVTTQPDPFVFSGTVMWSDGTTEAVVDVPTTDLAGVIGILSGFSSPGAHIPTSQLLAETQKVESYYAPPSAIGMGYTWADGSHRADMAETFRETSHTETDYVYASSSDAQPCRLTRKTITTKGWYAPQTAPTVGGSLAISQEGTAGTAAFAYRAYFYDGVGRLLSVSPLTETTTSATHLNQTDFNRITPSAPSGAVNWSLERVVVSTPAYHGSGFIFYFLPISSYPHLDDPGVATEGGGYAPHQYDDGSTRSEAFSYREVSKVEESYKDNLIDVEAGTTAKRVAETDHAESAWVTVQKAQLGYGWYDNLFPTEQYVLASTTITIQSGLAWQTTHITTVTTTSYDGSSSWSSKTEAGAVSGPALASGDTPQYSQNPITSTVTAWTDVFSLIARTETSQDAESIRELTRVAKRRMRSELGLRYVVTLPLVRGLNLWDTVGLYDSARNLTGQAAWIERITITASVLNGWQGMEITAVLPPAGV